MQEAILRSEYRFIIRNPQVMDDLRELQAGIYAFSDYKAVLATGVLVVVMSASTMSMTVF